MNFLSRMLAQNTSLTVYETSKDGLVRVGQAVLRLFLMAKFYALLLLHWIQLAGAEARFALSHVLRSVALTAKDILFPKEPTVEEILTLLMPLAVTLLLIGGLAWWSKTETPLKPAQQTLRRSTRLARKRAMLCSGDLSSLLPPCEKAPTTPPNL